MESLYVCLFSNGLIKVGRSIDPRARAAAHADRVACTGLLLSDLHTVRCVDRPVQRESALIARCADAATARYCNEWFMGLQFSDVSDWANVAAQLMEFSDPGISVMKDIRQRLGFTQAVLAERLGCTQGNVVHYERPDRPQTVPPDVAKRLIAVVRDAGQTLTLDQVYGLEPLPDDWAPAAEQPAPT